MPLFAELRDFLGSVIAFPADYFAGWWGVPPSESGVQVNELTAMQIGAYVACVRIISSIISTLPLKVYERKPDGSIVEAPDHPLSNVLTVAPNPEMCSADFMQTGQVHCLQTGNAYIEIRYNGYGQPAGLYLRSPFVTFPWRDAKTGAIIYKTKDTLEGYERTIALEDMIHVKGMGLDGLMGLSPIKYYAREVLGVDLAAQSYSAKFFANDSRPGGYLQAPGNLSPQQKLDAVQTWIQSHGRGNSHTMAVLEGGWSWQKVGVDPQEAQFLESRQFNRSQIGAIFGVPGHMLGDDADAPRTSLEQRNLEFLIYTIKPWANKWAQAINSRLFPQVGRNANRYFAKFDTTELERTDYGTLLKGIQMARYAGLMTMNDGRKLLNLSPLAKEDFNTDNPADKLMIPVNMAPVEAASAEPPAKKPPTGGKPEEGGPGGEPTNGGVQAPANGTPSLEQKKADPAKEIRHYLRVFEPAFSDALHRISARNKPTEKDFLRTFEPVLISIASALRGAEVEDPVLPAEVIAFIRSYISGMVHRAAALEVAAELERAVRTLKTKVSADLDGDGDGDEPGEGDSDEEKDNEE